MKINDSTPPERNDAAATSSRRNGTANASATPAATSAGVNVSPLAAQVRELSSRLVDNTDADIDVDKVAEIRQAIADGTLPMNAEKIADGLLDSMRELVQGN